MGWTSEYLVRSSTKRKSTMKLLSALLNFVFDRTFNLFDLIVFSIIWRFDFHLFDWQFWAILIPGMIVSAIGVDFTATVKRLTKLL